LSKNKKEMEKNYFAFAFAPQWGKMGQNQNIKIKSCKSRMSKKPMWQNRSSSRD
jgi:hypothetical protein